SAGCSATSRSSCPRITFSASINQFCAPTILSTTSRRISLGLRGRGFCLPHRTIPRPTPRPVALSASTTGRKWRIISRRRTSNRQPLTQKNKPARHFEKKSTLSGEYDREVLERIQESDMEVLDRTTTTGSNQVTRRQFFKAAVCGAGGLALYAGEIERHWLETSHYEVALPGLAPEFDGYRVAQLSDIHMDEFTEPFFVRDAVKHINQIAPDAIFITGDFVTCQIAPCKFAEGSAWQCANILTGLKCRQRYAVFGNHDV